MGNFHMVYKAQTKFLKSIGKKPSSEMEKPKKPLETDKPLEKSLLKFEA
jgi:hypothetical protein